MFSLANFSKKRVATNLWDQVEHKLARPVIETQHNLKIIEHASVHTIAFFFLAKHKGTDQTARDTQPSQSHVFRIRSESNGHLFFA